MDLCLALQSIHDELLTFFPNESGVTTSHSLHGTGQRRTGLKTPPFPWTVATSLKLLAQYSSGLTREILFTDLESFWRRELRRGSASTVQLTPIIAQSKSHSSSSSSPALTKTDVLTGSVVLRPSGKYQLVDSERQAIDFIPHRQMSDFNGFLSHMLRLSSYHSLPQLCAFTQCRILQLTPSSPPILLPSEITSPIFDYSLPSDATAIQLCFTPLHQNFCSSLASSLPSFSDESVTGLFAEVTYISSVLPYPVPAMNKQYRIIKLRFYSDIRETVTLTTPMKRSRSSPRAVFLILYENHVISFGSLY